MKKRRECSKIANIKIVTAALKGFNLSDSFLFKIQC